MPIIINPIPKKTRIMLNTKKIRKDLPYTDVLEKQLKQAKDTVILLNKGKKETEEMMRFRILNRMNIRFPIFLNKQV